MAQYLELPNGSLYEIRPGETKDEATARALQKYPEAFGFAQQKAQQSEGTALGDIATAFKQGAVGSTKALTDVFGVDNPLSQALEAKNQQYQNEYSAARKAEMQAQAARMQQAEKEGMLSEVGAGLKNIAEAPVQALAQGLGSLVPYAPTMFLGPVAQALKLAPKTISALTAVGEAAPKLLGTAQGAGAVKGAIYDAVYEKEKESGVDDAVAKQKAVAAQDYLGKNWEQIALGAGLGRIAGGSGAERLLTKKGAEEAAAKFLPRVAKAGLEEAITEGPQGAQERLAQNIALQRAGYDTPTLQGVAGQGVQEAVTGAFTAAPISAVRSPAGANAASEDELRKALEERQKAFEAQQQELAAKRQTPEYALDIAAKYEALQQKARELKQQADARPEDTDFAGQASKKEAQTALVELKKSKETRELTREYLLLKRNGSMDRALEAKRVEGMSPMEYLLDQTPTYTQEPFKVKADESGFWMPEPLLPGDNRELAAYAADRIKLANDVFYDTPSAEAVIEYLMTDPAKAAQLVASKIQLPGMSKKDSKDVLNDLAQALAEHHAEIKRGAEKGTAAGQQRISAVEDEEQTALAEQRRMREEDDRQREEENQKQEAKAKTINQFVGQYDMFSSEGDRIVSGEMQETESRASLIAALQIARAAGDRTKASELVERLHAMSEPGVEKIQQKKKQFLAAKKDAEKAGNLEAVASLEERIKELDAALNRKNQQRLTEATGVTGDIAKTSVPADVAARQEASDARETAFANLAQTVSKYHKGRLKQDEVDAARAAVVDNLIKEIEIANKQPLSDAQKADIRREANTHLRDLITRFGDTRDISKMPDQFVPHQKQTGEFRTDKAPNFGWPSTELVGPGKRTFGNPFAAAMTIKEALNDIRDRNLTRRPAITEQKTTGPVTKEQVREQLDRALRVPQYGQVGKLLAGADKNFDAIANDQDRLNTLSSLLHKLMTAGVRSQADENDLAQDLRDLQDAAVSETETFPGRQRTLYDKGAAPATRTQVQPELPLGHFGEAGVAKGILFDTPQEFDKYLASDALQALRTMFGITGQTASRIAAQVAGMQVKLDRINARIAQLQKQQADIKARGASENKAAQALLDESQKNLRSLENALDAELKEVYQRYATVRLRLMTAQEGVAQINQRIAENIAKFEGQESKLAKAAKNIAAQYEKITTLMKGYESIEQVPANFTQTLQKEHDKLISLLRAQRTIAAQTSNRYYNFLNADLKLALELRDANRSLAGLKGALTRITNELTVATEEQKSRAGYKTAVEDVAISTQLGAEAAATTSQELAPVETELGRLAEKAKGLRADQTRLQAPETAVLEGMPGSKTHAEKQAASEKRTKATNETLVRLAAMPGNRFTFDKRAKLLAALDASPELLAEHAAIVADPESSENDIAKSKNAIVRITDQMAKVAKLFSNETDAQGKAISTKAIEALDKHIERTIARIKRDKAQLAGLDKRTKEAKKIKGRLDDNNALLEQITKKRYAARGIEQTKLPENKLPEKTNSDIAGENIERLQRMGVLKDRIERQDANLSGAKDALEKAKAAETPNAAAIANLEATIESLRNKIAADKAELQSYEPIKGKVSQATRTNVTGAPAILRTGTEESKKQKGHVSRKVVESRTQKPESIGQTVAAANKMAQARISATAPMTEEEFNAKTAIEQQALIQAQERLQQSLVVEAINLQTVVDALKDSRSIEGSDRREKALQDLESIKRLLTTARATLDAFYKNRLDVPEVTASELREGTFADVGLGVSGEVRFARGVEGATPDLNADQLSAVQDNDIQSALLSIANDTANSELDRAVALRLADMLDATDIEVVGDLRDEEGRPVLGMATSKKVTLSARGGLSQEILLHEGTHAAVERVLMLDESKLTKEQLIAKRELQALFASIKGDASITSASAKGSLSEFVAEVFSNKTLQEQLRRKKWRMSNAWEGIKSVLLRLLGVNVPDTALGAALASVDTLMIPSSQRTAGAEKPVNRRLSVKDIAALHSGSNSMKQFSEQFGPLIKQADRSPEDAERIASALLDDMYDNEENYIPRADPDKLDYVSDTRMSDGELYNPDSLLHYLEATPATYAALDAQENAALRDREAQAINQQRYKDFHSLVKYLVVEGPYTAVENALVAKAATKYGVTNDHNGRLKLVEINATNRHPIAVVGKDAAEYIIQELRAGKGLKQAFLEGMQKRADENVKTNKTKNGWQKFEQADNEKAAVALNAGAAGTPWCTGANVSTARSQARNGDFYIYYEQGVPQVAVRMDGTSKINEVRGNSAKQALTPAQQQIAETFLRASNFDGAQEYLSEFERMQSLKKLAAGDTSGFSEDALLGFDFGNKGTLDSTRTRRMLSFKTVDGYGNRPPPSETVTTALQNALQSAAANLEKDGVYVKELFFKAKDGASTLIFERDGKDVAVDSENLRKAKSLYHWSGTHVAPNLTHVQRLSVARGSKLDAPNIQYIDELRLWSSNAEVVLPNSAYVKTIVSGIVGDEKTPTVHGAQTVGNLELFNMYGHALRVKMPDVKYGAFTISKYGCMESAEKAIADAADKIITEVTEKLSDKIAAKDADADVLLAEAKKQLTSFFKNVFSETPPDLRNKFVSAFVNAPELAEFFEWQFEEDPITDLHWYFVRPVTHRLNRSFGHLPEAVSFAKALNNFLPADKQFKVTELDVQLPSWVASTPPVDQLEEVTERPRYARQAAPTYSNTDFARIGKTADKIIAKERGMMDVIKEGGLGLQLATHIADRFRPLEKLSKLMEPLRGLQMMYYARMYDQRMNFVAQTVEHGALKLKEMQRKDGRVERVIEAEPGASLRGVVKTLTEATPIVGNAAANSQMFSMYLLAKRAQRVGLDKLHFGGDVSEADLADVLRTVEGNSKLHDVYKRSADLYNQYNRDMLDFAVTTGTLSQSVRDTLVSSGDYVPYYRQHKGGVEMMLGDMPIAKVGSLKDQPYLQELVGGSKPVLDFMTSAVQNTNMLVDMSLRNLATKNAVYELHALGMAKIGKGHEAQGPDVVRYKEHGVDKYAIIETDSVEVNGKTYQTGVPATLLVKGLEGVPIQSTLVTKMFGGASRVLRKSIMLNPAYAARQLFRDSLAATIASGANFTPVLGALREVGSARKATLERRGVVGGQVFTGTPEDLTKVLRDLSTNPSGFAQAMSKMEAISMESDALSRRAQYNSYIQQGLSEMEATLASLESMNFSRRGINPALYQLSAAIPFFNAQIQSLDVLYRAFRGQMPLNEKLKIREKLLKRGMLLAAASMAYAAMMQDDEAYKNATPEQKYGYWFVPLPNTSERLRLPIPFEIGYIFKAIPEAIVNAMANEEGGKEAFDAFKQIVLQTIPGGSSYGVPALIKPMVEVGLNKSFYTGRDLESAYEQTLEPFARTRPTTTALAKHLGEMFNVSPIKIDALLSGYMSSTGLALADALGFALPSGGKEDNVEKRLSELRVVGSLFQPADAGGVINATYDRMQEAEMVAKTFDALIERGDTEKAKAFLNANLNAYALSGVATSFTSTMRELSEVERTIRASDASPAEKRARLDKVRQLKISFASSVREAASEKTTRQ